MSQQFRDILQKENYKKGTKDYKTALKNDNQEKIKELHKELKSVLSEGNTNIEPYQILLAARLLKECVLIGNSTFLTLVQDSSKGVLNELVRIISERKNEKYANYGRYMFSKNPTDDEKQVGKSVAFLMIECIYVWNIWFNIDPKTKKPSNFALAYKNLRNLNIQFPEEKDLNYFQPPDIQKFQGAQSGGQKQPAQQQQQEGDEEEEDEMLTKLEDFENLKEEVTKNLNSEIYKKIGKIQEYFMEFQKYFATAEAPADEYTAKVLKHDTYVCNEVLTNIKKFEANLKTENKKDKPDVSTLVEKFIQILTPLMEEIDVYGEDNKQMEQYQQEIAALQEDINGKNKQLQVLQTKASKSEQNATSLQKKIDKLEEEAVDLKNQIEKQNKKLNLLENESSLEKQVVSQISGKQTQELQSIQKEVQELKNDLAEEKNNIRLKNEEINKLQNDKNDLKQEVKRLQMFEGKYEQLLQENQSNGNQKSEQLNEKTEQLIKARDQVSELQGTVREQKFAIQTVEQDKKKFERKVNDLQEQLEEYDELRAKYQQDLEEEKMKFQLQINQEKSINMEALEKSNMQYADTYIKLENEQKKNQENENKVMKLNQQIIELQEDLEQQQKINAANKNNNNDNNDKKNNNEVENQGEQQINQENINKIKELQKKIVENEKKIKELHSQVDDLTNKNTELNNDYLKEQKDLVSAQKRIIQLESEVISNNGTQNNNNHNNGMKQNKKNRDQIYEEEELLQEEEEVQIISKKQKQQQQIPVSTGLNNSNNNNNGSQMSVQQQQDKDDLKAIIQEMKSKQEKLEQEVQFSKKMMQQQQQQSFGNPQNSNILQQQQQTQSHVFAPMQLQQRPMSSQGRMYTSQENFNKINTNNNNPTSPIKLSQYFGASPLNNNNRILNQSQQQQKPLLLHQQQQNQFYNTASAVFPGQQQQFQQSAYGGRNNNFQTEQGLNNMQPKKVAFDREKFNFIGFQNHSQIVKFQKSCIKLKYPIFTKENQLVVGLMSDDKVQDPKNIKVQVFFTNKGQQLIQNLSFLMDDLNVPQQANNTIQLEAGSQKKLDVFIPFKGDQKIIWSRLQYSVNNEHIKEQIPIPNTMYRFLEQLDTQKNLFLEKWEHCQQNIQSTDKHKIETKVVDNVLAIQSKLNLQNLTNDTLAQTFSAPRANGGNTFNNQEDLENKNSNARLGGVYYLRETNTKILFKILGFPGNQIGFEASHISTTEAEFMHHTFVIENFLQTMLMIFTKQIV